VAALDSLDRRLRALGATRVKLERLYDRGLLARRDLERVYEGLYVASVTAFEDFLEARFFELVLKPEARTSRVIPRADFKSAAVLREFVLGDRPYVNWLPFTRTEARANVHLRGARPFDAVTQTDKRQMKDWMTIRHAIAHTSREARRKLEAEILSGVPLPPRERTPAGFLRSTLRPGVTRYENIVRQMLAIGSKLA
jgi:hypothetical protein